MAALIAFLVIPLWGQRGGHGGMAMGGVGGGYVARGGFVGSPRGGYWGGGFHPVYGPGFPTHPGHYPYFFPGHYPYYPRHYPWWAYRRFYGYPWRWGWYGGMGIGWLGSSYSYTAQPYPGYADAPADNSSANVAYAQQQQEIDRLNDEVARLRAERAPSLPATQAPEAQIRAETVLVFRDHHSEEIQNYAIVGETLWVFTEQRARKIPIAALDVPATTKANDSRGIDFRLPGRQITP